MVQYESVGRMKMNLVIGTKRESNDDEQPEHVLVRPVPKLEPNLRSSYIFVPKGKKVNDGQEKEFARTFSAL